MKVLFFCAMAFDWENMKQIPDSIQKWNKFHGMDFFKYRKVIAEVAVESWRATGADVYINPTTWWNHSVGQSFHDTLDLTKEQLDVISQYDFVVQVDDDDLVSPDFLSKISNYDKNILVWDCLLFQVWGNELRTYKSYAWSGPEKEKMPYFHNDVGHWRGDNIHGWWELASATYGVRTKWLLANKKRNIMFFSHHYATNVFAEGGDRHKGCFPQVQEINECLGCKVMHGANVSVMNFEQPLKPIHNIDVQWRPHWPGVFKDYYKKIQNNVNSLLENNE